MIGYYVHHHGSGHLARASQIVPHLKAPVTILSSTPRPANWPGRWLELSRDDTGPEPRDATAHGAFHWVPRHDRGLRTRMHQLVEWIEREEPALIVADVSVEVAALARLTGTPVAIMAMPGDRGDSAHRLAYTFAELLIAPWLPGHDLGTAGRDWADKTRYVGAFSRFDTRSLSAADAPERARRGPRALLLWGTGGTELPDAMLAEARSATPDWSWTLAGPGHFLDEDTLWAELCAADVVVTHAGQNAVSDVAAARKPSVVIASPRPFDEQAYTARALGAAHVAVGLEHWPAPRQWPELLDRALRIGGHRWRCWSTGRGAQDCARYLGELMAATPSPRRTL